MKQTIVSRMRYPLLPHILIYPFRLVASRPPLAPYDAFNHQKLLFQLFRYDLRRFAPPEFFAYGLYQGICPAFFSAVLRLRIYMRRNRLLFRHPRFQILPPDPLKFPPSLPHRSSRQITARSTARQRSAMP